MDQYEALRQYNEQQRRERLAREQRQTEEQQRLSQLSQEHHLARERERVEAAQRHSQEQVARQEEVNVKKQHEREEHHVRMRQIAEQLHTTEQQRREALNAAVARLAESVQTIRKSGDFIELPFWDEWKRIVENEDFTPKIALEREFHIGRYRVDFACVDVKVAIELDGHATHSSKQARTKDYQRQRFLEDQGWSFVRFTGSEIYADVTSCVEIAIARIKQRIE